MTSPPPQIPEPAHPVNPMIATAVLFALGLGLLLAGVMVYPPVHGMAAALDATAAGAVLLALLAIHAFLLREHRRVLLELALLSFFLVPTALALSVGGVMLLNGHLDRGEASRHTAPVLEAYVDRTSAGLAGPAHRLRVYAWRRGQPHPWLDVRPEVYAAVTPGATRVEVTTRPGWLGIEWIVAVRTAP